MPELPEVETIRKQLSDILVGKIIEEIEVLNPKSWDGNRETAKETEIVGVRRFGKALVIDVADRTKEQAGLSLVIHLKMTGQLIYEPYGSGSLNQLEQRVVGGHPTGDFVNRLPSKHTRVIVKFKVKNEKLKIKVSSKQVKSIVNGQMSNVDDGGVLYFNDQRKFGWIKLFPTTLVEKLGFIKNLGKEPWEMTPEEWKNFLQSSKKPVKVRLMDQGQLAGVGNIYANDACWEAQIDPRRPASSLCDEEMVVLLEKVKLVLDEGIKYGGATSSNYVNLHGLGGKYQEHFRVYQRNGKECLRKDGGVIQKATVGGRGTYWCDVCQK